MSHPKQFKYPQQLITALVEQADERLLNFYNKENKKYFSPHLAFQDIINDTLKDFVKDETSTGDLKNIQTTQTRMRRQKKARWAKTIETNSRDYEITSKKNPFYNIYLQYSLLSNEQFEQLYGLNDVDEVIVNYQQKVKEWQSDSKQYLIEYPLITSQTAKQVLAAFKIDLIINLIDIIVYSLGGNIDSFLRKQPEILIDAPFFSPAKRSVPLQKYFDAMAATLFQSDELQFEILSARSDTDDDDDDMEVMDFIDNQILAALISFIKPDFYESRQVFSLIGKIAQFINDRPNARHYDLVKKRLNKMATISFRYKNLKKSPADQGLTFAFLDKVLINSYPDGREYCSVIFSTTLYDAIIQKKMISVTSSSYNTLDLELSKLLYHSLQRERILLFMSPGPDDNNLLYKSYDISFFQRAVLFKTQKKAKNIALIKTTLNEFQEKKIAVHHYTVEDSRFHIFYYSLTADEKIDLLEDYGSVLSVDEIAPDPLLLIDSKMQ